MALWLINGLLFTKTLSSRSVLREALSASTFQPQEEGRGKKQPLIWSSTEGFSVKSLSCNPFSAYASGPWTLTPLLHQHDRMTRARAKVRTGRAVSSFMTWNFFKKRTTSQRTLFELAHERFWDGLTLPVQNQLIPEQLWFLPSMTHPSISFTPLCWRGNTNVNRKRRHKEYFYFSSLLPLHLFF